MWLLLAPKGCAVIVIRLLGGLGNQLFQYATGRRLANLHGVELVIDDYWYSHTPTVDTPRTYELSNYPIKARLAGPYESLWCRLQGGRITRRIPFLPRRWKTCRENGFGFQPDVLQLPDGVYLDGYWQSYRYFEDISNILREELNPYDAMDEGDIDIAKKMESSQSVSIHVRRGDYVTNPAAIQHGVCGLDYYKNATKYVIDHLSRAHFFVFSDDIEWSRKNLSLPGDVTYVDHNTLSTAHQDLRLMSLCKHHIMANSSFSWWGAWLNPDEQKMVVCPKQWFTDSRDTSHLTPPEWIRL